MYRFQLWVTPSRMAEARQAITEAMTEGDVQIKGKYPKVTAEMDPIRKQRYSAFGALADVLKEFGASRGWTLEEDWGRMLGIKVSVRERGGAQTGRWPRRAQLARVGRRRAHGARCHQAGARDGDAKVTVPQGDLNSGFFKSKRLRFELEEEEC
ncbi:unnamed protein product [Prorocentrum cordatum]|uniref:Uncharacterized protein n=1 Tax=Prorocentrum cordatum TaxID=2364126 RepID=A0ABN9W130_9DINO|nr:unnamed protein product [Polarella glacialis]